MQDLIGKKVTVHSHLGGAEKQDVGVIEAFDGTVVRLKKETETLFLVIYSIRLIKPF